MKDLHRTLSCALDSWPAARDTAAQWVQCHAKWGDSRIMLTFRGDCATDAELARVADAAQGAVWAAIRAREFQPRSSTDDRLSF